VPRPHLVLHLLAAVPDMVSVSGGAKPGVDANVDEGADDA
jgi:hypothetical protein